MGTKGHGGRKRWVKDEWENGGVPTEARRWKCLKGNKSKSHASRIVLEK